MMFFNMIVLLRYYRPPPLKDMWNEGENYIKAEEYSEREDKEDNTNKRFRHSVLKKEDFETNDKLKNIEESLVEAK